MSLYCSLKKMKRATGVIDWQLASATEDPKYLDALQEATRLIDEWTGFWFEPRYQTRAFDSLGVHIDDLTRTLDLDMWLAAVKEIKVGVEPDGSGGTALVAGTDYSFYPRGKAATLSLRRLSASWSSATSLIAGSYVESISVTGLWVLHRLYLTDGWRLGSALSAGVNNSPSTTTIPLTTGTGSTFDIGQLVRFGTAVDAEMGYVSATAADSITIDRAVNGSSIAAHSSADSVYYWQPEPIIEDACAQLAGLIYNQYGQYAGNEGIGGVKKTKPERFALPRELVDKLTYFKDRRGVAV